MDKVRQLMFSQKMKHLELPQMGPIPLAHLPAELHTISQYFSNPSAKPARLPAEKAHSARVQPLQLHVPLNHTQSPVR